MRVLFLFESNLFSGSGAQKSSNVELTSQKRENTEFPLYLYGNGSDKVQFYDTFCLIFSTKITLVFKLIIGLTGNIRHNNKEDNADCFNT